jgi:hypothetical protein
MKEIGEKMVEGHVGNYRPTINKFKKLFDLLDVKSLFEIGFQGGHSARIFLSLRPDDFHMHSIDICQYGYEAGLAEDLMIEDRRFSFTNMSSRELMPEDLKDYDMIFLDGDLTEPNIEEDINLCVDSNVKYIVVDDYSKVFPQVKYWSNYAVERSNYVWLGNPIPYLAEALELPTNNYMRVMVREDLIENFPPSVQKLFNKK